MRAIQPTAGSDNNGGERQPLASLPAAGFGPVTGCPIPTLNEAKNLAYCALSNLARGLRGDLTAPAPAGATVVGLALTATGFLKIRWTRPAGPPQEVGSTLRSFHAGGSATPVGYHPAVGQPPGQHAVSGPVGRHS